MEDFDNLPEVLFGSGESARSQTLGRLVKRGRLRKLAPKLYTSNLTDTPEVIVRRNVWRIAAQMAPDAVVSHRTAFEATPAEDGSIFLTAPYARNIALPGHTLRLVEGPGALEGDTPFVDGLYMASRPRALLENLTRARARSGVAKALSREQIEKRLDQIARLHGEGELNTLRDAARRLSPKLPLGPEAFADLDRLIGAVLGTRDARALRTEGAKARALGVPYDPDRLELFQALFGALMQTPHPRRLKVERPDEARHRAFFEAYFSNYIEGTEFEIEEARAIVYEGRLSSRPVDAHDIVGTFRLAVDPKSARELAPTAARFLELVLARHGTLMAQRPEADPGRFKEANNRAGNTMFVAPPLVRGTLEQGFGFLSALTEPFARAAYMMFLVAEVHPFTDGNGRVARLFMNAELSAAGEARIIIPTVYRDDYLGALRRLSRDRDPAPYLAMLDRAHAWSASLGFSGYDAALAQLTTAEAFREPTEGRLRFDTPVGN